jgi:hypothetical protein
MQGGKQLGSANIAALYKVVSLTRNSPSSGSFYTAERTGLCPLTLPHVRRPRPLLARHTTVFHLPTSRARTRLHVGFAAAVDIHTVRVGAPAMSYQGRPVAAPSFLQLTRRCVCVLFVPCRIRGLETACASGPKLDNVISFPFDWTGFLMGEGGGNGEGVGAL